jgi:hypothetical protein
MANLVKITGVKLLTAMNSEAARMASRECIAILKAADIEYDHLHYSDEQVPVILEGISSWAFGEKYEQYKMDSLPIVLYKTFFDDYERWIQVAKSPDELRNSVLLANTQLIV